MNVSVLIELLAGENTKGVNVPSIGFAFAEGYAMAAFQANGIANAQKITAAITTTNVLLLMEIKSYLKTAKVVLLNWPLSLDSQDTFCFLLGFRNRAKCIPLSLIIEFLIYSSC